MSKERVLSLDIARAMMIVLVVIGHYDPVTAPEWYKTMLKVIYTFHMPVFLFVSGYVYIATKKEESYINFLLKKVKRLLVPYYVTSLLVITIKLLTQGSMHVQTPVTMSAYIEMLYLPIAGYFLWFVLALWWMFVIVPWFKTRAQRLMLMVVSVVLAFLPMELTDVMCMNELKKMMVYFMCGVVAYDYKDEMSEVLTRLSRSIVVPIVFVLMEILYFGYGVEQMKYVLPFVGIAAVMQLSDVISVMAKGMMMKVLLYCSAASYIIYLFHTTFEGFAKSVVMKFGSILPAGEMGFVIGAILVIVAGVIGPMCANEVFKRFAITRVLFGLK